MSQQQGAIYRFKGAGNKTHSDVLIPEWKPSYLGQRRPDGFQVPEGHGGRYSQAGAKGPWRKHVTVDVYLDGFTPAEVSDKLSAASEGLDDVTLNIDTEYDQYDDSSIHTYVSGHRDATPEEIETIKAYDAEALRQRSQQAMANVAAQREAVIKMAKELGLSADDLK